MTGRRRSCLDARRLRLSINALHKEQGESKHGEERAQHPAAGPTFPDRRYEHEASDIELIGVSGTFGIQTFDLVMTPRPREQVTLANIDRLFPELTLVEMKVTKKSIRNQALNGFFFGATERERAMATALGDKYLFAFVVLTAENEYRRPFAVLLALDELERRTRPWRVQYQVNFRTDLEIGDVASTQISS